MPRPHPPTRNKLARLQAFRPKPWEPLTEPLFEVNPPAKLGKVSPAEKEWYRGLVKTTALAVEHILSAVDWNYTNQVDYRFSGRSLGKLIAYTTVIAEVYLDGYPDGREVGNQLSRLVKTFGLIVHDSAAGATFGWPKLGIQVSSDDILVIVNRAFHGNYPDRVPRHYKELL